jgi:hypothetical protein
MRKVFRENMEMSFLKLDSRENLAFILVVFLAITLLAPIQLVSKVQAPTGDPWWNDSWPYRKKITVYHTMVTADLTNFPVLINLTDADLTTKTQSNGYDIAFTDNIGNKLNHEIEFFNKATGKLAAWVQIPNLPSASDTILYMYYGNPSASNQQNKTGVWDSNYKMVQHLSETSGTHYDSTANGKNAVPNGGVSQGITGKIDGADSFVSDTNKYLSVGSIISAGDWTTSFWAYSRSITSQLVYYPIGLGGSKGIGMGGTYGGPDPPYDPSDYFSVFNGTDPKGVLWGGPLVQINTWYYVVITRSGTSCTIYVNGALQVTGTLLNIFIDNLNIGRRSDVLFPFNGIIDEVRVSNIPRSSAVISTEYSNQQAPSSFYSVGSEEINQIPPMISDPSPANGATEMPTSLSKLNFTLTDPNNDHMNYAFTTDPDIGHGSVTDVTNGRYTISVSGLQPNTAYTWHIEATDPSPGSGQPTTATFSFSTSGYLGQSWLSGWQYRKSHVITQAAEAGTNYQTEIRISYLDSTYSWFTVLPTNLSLFMTNDVSSNGTVFAGDSNYRIYKSIDNGTTFTRIFTIPTQSNPWGLMAGRVWTTFVDSRNYVFVSAGSTNRLYRSTDYGVSFTEVLNMPDRTTYSDADIISMTEDSGHHLYAAEYADTMPPDGGGARLWKSTDAGATWTSVSQRWQARHLHGVFYNPFNDWLYVLTGESGGVDYQTVWRSKDGGDTWVCVVPRVAGDDYATKYLSVEFINNDVYMGQDHQFASDPARIQKITDDGTDGPFIPVTVYDSPYRGALFTSATKLGDTMIFSTCSESVEGATCQVVMSNNGSTWTVLNAQPVSLAYEYINRLTVNPRTGFVYGCININYPYFIAPPSTPRPPPLQPTYSPGTVLAERHCRTDFGDIRFTDNDGITPLDYWMETKTDGDSAVFWVKVADDLSSEDRTIYVYYGKSDATTTSNPDNTFLFFDGFSGDLSKWTIASGTWTSGNGNLTIQPPDANNYLVTTDAIGVNSIAIRTKIASTQVSPTPYQAHPGVIWHANALTGTSQRNDQVYFRPHETSISSTQGNIQPAYYQGTGGPYGNGIVPHDYKAGSYFNWNTWHIVEVRVPSSGNVKLYGNDVYWHDWGNQQYSNDHIGLVAQDKGKDYFDYVAVRKYVDPEPAHSTWGTEETLTINSCNSAGTKKDTYDPGAEIWVNGSKGYSPSTTYPIYVVADIDWNNGMSIPTTRVEGTVETVTSNPDGSILVRVWVSARPGKYDIVIDFDGDGVYDEGIDPLDNNQVVETAGFFVIPEYALGTILALAACFAGVAVYRRSKHKNQRLP